MPRLFGFEDAAHRKVCEAEAVGVRSVASRRLAPQAWEPITEWANAEGYRTTLGGLWKPGPLATMMNHPAIAGLEEGENGELVESGGPALIPPEDFLAIRAMRQTKGEPVPAGEYLIQSWLGVCGLCGCPLSASPTTTSGSRGYRCAPSSAQHPGGCGRVRIKAEPFEVYVAEHVLAETAKPEVAALLGQARDELLAEAAELRKLADSLRRRQVRLGQSYARSPDMSVQAFRAADKELKQQAREARTKARFLDQAKHVPVADVPDLVRWWTHAPMSAKRGMLALMLEQVALYPAASKGSRRVDADRVGLRWRTWGTGAKGRG
ncbi:recombinase family protein [Streptomyces sp. PTM05]|uniref:Recombinase family protein n=1 Tax=Streptantibioticus parmotrematis TaxID=2873249 RepID=A0ABS7QNJ4_9ACTN|nr:recombinase family protein [Streptantibioticus parmotrematis]MBY8884750.1 recombinase family protein [Streptantibioticus parmotrematis]